MLNDKILTMGKVWWKLLLQCISIVVIFYILKNNTLIDKPKSLYITKINKYIK